VTKTLVEQVVPVVDDLMKFNVLYTFRDGSTYKHEVLAKSYDEAKIHAGKVTLPSTEPCTFTVIPVIEARPFLGGASC
jgi:hypothetical protein